MKRNPRLYQGIEQKVAEEVFTAFKNGTVGAEALANTDYWDGAAAVVRISQGDWDIGKYRNVQPVSPVYTDTPSPQRPPAGPVQLTPEQAEAARLGGFSREQFAQMLQGTREEAARRAM